MGYYKFEHMYSVTYDIVYALLSFSAAALGSLVIGILLGMNRFLKAKEKRTQWRVNVAKLIFVGLPFFIIAFWFPVRVLINSAVPVPMELIKMLSTESVSQLAALIAGYALITSFDRVD